MHEKLVAPWDFDSVGRAHVSGMAEQQLGGQDAFGEQAAGPVQVGQHGVEHPRSLQQAGLEHLPVGRGQHDRQGVQLPGPGLLAVTAGLDVGVGDAVVVDEVVHHRAQPVQPAAAALRDGVGQLGPRRAHVAVLVDEFVVAACRAVPQIEQRFLGPRGTVSGQQAIGVVTRR